MKKILLFIIGVLIISQTTGYVGANEAIDQVQNINVDIDVLDNSDIKKASIDIEAGNNITDGITDAALKFLNIIKYVFQGVLLIYMVYIGVQMIMSMGSDEEELSSAKRQLWYSIIGILFINLPGSLYNAFQKTRYGNIDGAVNGGNWNKEGGNLFIDMFAFEGVYGNIIGAMEVFAGGIAILMLIYTGIKIMLSRGDEEVIKDAKGKITWSIVALVFVSFIESIKRFAFTGDTSVGTGIFSNITNILLFFAIPVAIFFVCLAGYYYITANGDEERAKKGKNIIINVVLATLILLASMTFFREILTL